MSGHLCWVAVRVPLAHPSSPPHLFIHLSTHSFLPSLCGSPCWEILGVLKPLSPRMIPRGTPRLGRGSRRGKKGCWDVMHTAVAAETLWGPLGPPGSAPTSSFPQPQAWALLLLRRRISHQAAVLRPGWGIRALCCHAPRGIPGREPDREVA